MGVVTGEAGVNTAVTGTSFPATTEQQYLQSHTKAKKLNQKPDLCIYCTVQLSSYTNYITVKVHILCVYKAAKL